jgi:hypothetical protein
MVSNLRPLAQKVSTLPLGHQEGKYTSGNENEKYRERK